MRPRKWENDAQRRAAQNELRKIQRKLNPGSSRDVKFIAIDGEGMGNNADHRYVLLGVDDQQIDNPDGLGFHEIMSFLWEQYLENHKAAFVGFFLGYDFTQWFRGLPEERARMLLTVAGRAKRARLKHPQLGPFPVQYGDWEFDLLGMKRMKLRRRDVKSGWMYINDSGGFFQASLLSVIDPKNWAEPIVSENEYETIREGKERRDSAVLDKDMRRYNVLENIVFARLMGRYDAGLTQAGIRLRKNQWFGPGQAAQAWMNKTELPTRETIIDTIPRKILNAARWSYYGGWFEIFAHGHIPGISYEYDINSAYPFIASQLPCLLHGKWHNGTGIPGKLRDNAIRIAHATVRGTDRHMGSMLHRLPEGTIRRPQKTAGWYWQSELDAACRAGVIDKIEYIEWAEYDPCNCRPPLRGLVGLYDARLRAGKNSAEGKGLKLIYNSMYGKLAQSVGNPKYANAIYASLITSGCREMILNAIATHPDGTSAVLMVATDGVYFTTPNLSLPISEKIGDWSVSEKENLTLFKPGVYWDDRARRDVANGENPHFKARGVNAREFGKQLRNVDNQFGRWPESFPADRDPEGIRDGWYPKVKFTSNFSMVTCTQALQYGKWELAGSVTSDRELTQDSDPSMKRHSGYYENGIYWSRPYANGGEILESTPYNKSFGEQPEREEYGITPDGYVIDQWKRMFT